MEEFAKFLFVGSAAVALFAFLTITSAVSIRAAERRDRERMALLRKIAELPPDTAAVMRELLREEAGRMERRESRKRRESRHESMQAGAVLLAVGAGLSIFLAAIARDEPVWTIGVMVVLMGLVFLGFAWLAPGDASERDTAAPPEVR